MVLRGRLPKERIHDLPRGGSNLPLVCPLAQLIGLDVDAGVILPRSAV